jgi:hypothetical protein
VGKWGTGRNGNRKPTERQPIRGNVARVSIYAATFAADRQRTQRAGKPPNDTLSQEYKKQSPASTLGFAFDNETRMLVAKSRRTLHRFIPTLKRVIDKKSSLPATPTSGPPGSTSCTGKKTPRWRRGASRYASHDPGRVQPFRPPTKPNAWSIEPRTERIRSWNNPRFRLNRMAQPLQLVHAMRFH